MYYLYWTLLCSKYDITKPVSGVLFFLSLTFTFTPGWFNKNFTTSRCPLLQLACLENKETDLLVVEDSSGNELEPGPKEDSKNYLKNKDLQCSSTIGILIGNISSVTDHMFDYSQIPFACFITDLALCVVLNDSQRSMFDQHITDAFMFMHLSTLGK